MTNPLPSDPLPKLLADAVQQHELVLTYVAAGFSRAEAMQLLCTMVAAAVTAQTRPPS